MKQCTVSQLSLQTGEKLLITLRRTYAQLTDMLHKYWVLETWWFKLTQFVNDDKALKHFQCVWRNCHGYIAHNTPGIYTHVLLVFLGLIFSHKSHSGVVCSVQLLQIQITEFVVRAVKKKAILVFSKLLYDWMKLSILEIWKLFVLFMFTKCCISYCKWPLKPQNLRFQTTEHNRKNHWIHIQ